MLRKRAVLGPMVARFPLAPVLRCIKHVLSNVLLYFPPNECAVNAGPSYSVSLIQTNRPQ